MKEAVFFISDLHLTEPTSARYQRVLELLGQIGPRAKAIYLLGDIFDFWIGYRDTVFAAFRPFLDCIQSLVSSGTEIFFVPGNHDPELGPVMAKFGLIELKQPIQIQLGESRVWLEHGDRWETKLMGALACRAVRNKRMRMLARLIPKSIAWKLAEKYASRRSHSYHRLLDPSLYEHFLSHCARHGCDVAVIGHFHRAVHYRIQINGKERTLFVLGDWLEQYTYLQWHEGTFSLMRDQNNPENPVTLPLGDHGPGSPERL